MEKKKKFVLIDNLAICFLYFALRELASDEKTKIR